MGEAERPMKEPDWSPSKVALAEVIDLDKEDEDIALLAPENGATRDASEQSGDSEHEDDDEEEDDDLSMWEDIVSAEDSDDQEGDGISS